MTALTVPRADEPLVSVVMVTYGGWDWPLRSLTTLIENTDPVYEVVVVDNDSPDGTGARLEEEIEGVTLVRNDHNAGFGPAANQGAGLAKGDFLCFLNPDTQVEPGWLPPMLDVLKNDPRAGAAVPRLLNIDGSLQEAGSLVGIDGSTWAFGNGEHPEDFQYRFRRYVDYGSAACLVMPRSLFRDVGGFHPEYVPAYCEDVDLCLAIAERGLRTVYQPRSIVRHARSASTDLERAQTLIERNRRILHHRWMEKLARRPWLDDLPFYPHRIIAARDAEEVDRILVILDTVPSGDARDPDSRLVLEMASLWPTARITLAAADARGAATEAIRFLDRGVEIAAGSDDWSDWFARRRYHYSVVIVRGDTNVERFGEVLRKTQPQAAWFQLAEGDRRSEPTGWTELRLANDGPGFRKSLVEAMAGVGIAPPMPVLREPATEIHE
jgi:O-antigen biosynthesis protein